MSPFHPSRFTRRTALQTTAAGFGYMAFNGLMAAEAIRKGEPLKPLAPRDPHFPAKAKRIIFVFMEGSMSQHDTFEYKPELFAKNGKPGPGGGTLTASKFKFSQHGQTGTWFSELLPSIAKHSDKLCWLRGL
ncbi:MAG TPA: DUF1501 domain-containing protein, partial [Prosthecobacter sp.]